MTSWSDIWARWRHSPSSLLFAAALALCALFIALMPLSGTLRQKWAYAMHGREDNAVTMAAVQVVPKMYNFANRYAYSYVELTPEQLSNPPSSLPPSTEYEWMNHYPSWIMTANPLVLFPKGQPQMGYLYLFSRWKGEEIVTGYKIHFQQHGRARGQILIKRITP